VGSRVYSLIFAAKQLSAEAIGDRRGAEGALTASMGVFSLVSLGRGLSPTTVQIGVRCIQGLGAVLAVPTSLALLQAAYPEQMARRRAYWIWGGVTGIAAGSGPVVGRALVSGLGWGSAVVAVGLVVFVPTALTYVVVERRVTRPMLPLGLFTSSSFSAGTLVALAIKLVSTESCPS
jgi:DHA2 family methylenomycin A resistance protein-like MFS transporter